MKNKVRSSIAIMLVFTIVCTSGANAFAVGMNDTDVNTTLSEMTSREYYNDQGVFIEEVRFMENSENAAIIKRTYEDGSFRVEAISGEDSVVFEGDIVSQTIDSSALLSEGYSTNAVYTPYWSAGYTDYSKNGVALTIAVIGALIAAHTGLSPSEVVGIAGSIYQGLGGGSYDSNVYFRTYKYYATTDYGGDNVTWHNKFVTYTYSNSSRTKKLTGPDTVVHDSLTPM